MRPESMTRAQYARRAQVLTALMDVLDACGDLTEADFEEALANAITKRARDQRSAHAISQRIERDLYMRARHA